MDVVFATAVATAARALATGSQHAGAEFMTEKRLEKAVKESLESQGNSVHTRIHMPVPDWSPRPGGTDIVVGPRDSPLALAELKVARANGPPSLAEALWDLFKLAAQVGQTARRDQVLQSVDGAFLVTAAPVSLWAGHPRDTWHLGPRELFPEAAGERFEDSSCALFRRHRAAWEDLLWGGRGRPERIGQRVATEFVASELFQCKDVAWNLRCARVIARDDTWLVFEDEWPRCSGGRSIQAAT